MGMAHRSLFFLRRTCRGQLFSGGTDRPFRETRGTADGTAGLLHRVSLHYSERDPPDPRSHPTRKILAHADPVEHLTPDVQALVADVGGFLGTSDFRLVQLYFVHRCAR